MIGTTLAHYRITGELGSGGMGEVWRAEDEKLGREVALKVLPAEFGEDEQRLERFQREAKVLASLNHPNVAHLYGLETVASGTGSITGRQNPTPSSPATFLVMELVEGADLSERIARGPIPVDEVAPIALQIAEALEAAHEAGIVHRDLKPANIKLRPDGTVKVLDFGLAKAWETDAGDSSLSLSPTLTQHATAAGVILGTAAYMSPEQARGQQVDRRADIWAFGVVLWEMLTGTKLFEGETVTDVLASVLKEAPDLDALPDDTPPALSRLVERCLHREPRERLQWIGDARLELAEAAAHRPADTDPAVPKARHAGTGREVLAWSLAALAIVALLLVWPRPDDETGSELTRFSVVLGDDTRLSLVDLPLLDLSSDGRMVVFAAADLGHGQDVLHLRRLEDETITMIDGTEGASNPFFSPDGSSIGFFVDGKLKKVDIGGGSIVTLADAETPRGAVWLSDGTILFSPEYSAGLMSIDSGGGVPREIVGLDNEAGERTLRFPDVIPGGGAILFTVGMLDSPNNYDEARIDVYSPESDERKTILERANMARWVDDRTLVYARAGVLYAVAFDPERLEIVGQPVPVIEDLGGDPSSGAAHVAAAPDGTLIWVTGAVTETDSMLTVVHRNGEETRLPLEPRGFNQPRFSPDGSRLAVTIGEAISGIDGDVWIYSFASETLSRLTFDGNGLYPVWFADGRSIGFLSYLVNPSVLVRAVDGRGGNETFTKGSLSPIFPESVSPDGSTLAYTEVGQSSDIFLVERGGEPRLFQERASGPVFSPDGRWIAYSSPGAGSSSIFVRPVEGEGMWQVSPGLGGYPRWSGDGRKLFYIDIGTAKRSLMEVDVEDDDAFRASAPRVAIPDLGGRFMTTTAPASNWDAAPDGDRFIFVEFERDERSRGKIEIALDWAGQLELDRE
ncbi:MAG: protein kinase [Thermoanaerobaculales bacterium]|jgi:serine/threonine-protein kinase|nr:protein kinase [Thermoanaerobaculales bacterium]